VDQNRLYERILGLSQPWRVSSVELNESSGEITVEVGLIDGTLLLCPKCGKSCPRYDHRPRKWRHLDTCQFQTLIRSDVPRINCPEHGVLTIQVPWAEESSRYTQLFEGSVIRWLQETSIRAVSRRLGLSWSAIDGIMARAVKRGLKRRSTLDVTRLAVDETSFRKGHDYVTIVSNQHGQVLAVEEGKSSNSLATYYKSLSPAQCVKVESISMDMSPAFQKATLEYIPDARSKIAFDHFHIAQSLLETLNVTRKSELLQVDHRLRKHVHQTRYHWMRNRHTLNLQQKSQLDALVCQLSDTALVWYFKEKARDIWKGNRVRGASTAWREWIDLAKVSGIKPLQTTAGDIEKNLWGILNAMRLQASNALAEAINSKIRILRVKAHGYRNKERFKRAILFHFGGLSLEPTH